MDKKDAVPHTGKKKKEKEKVPKVIFQYSGL